MLTDVKGVIPMGSPRANRVPERIKEILAELVAELKDPRIGFVTITDVRTTPDFGHATVYYTVLGTPASAPAPDRSSTHHQWSSVGTPERSQEAVLGNEEADARERARTAEGLASALPLLRRELGGRLRLRQVPTLEFVHDPIPEHGRRIEQLIEQARRTSEH